MANSQSAAHLHDVIAHATAGDNRDFLEHSPDLSWLLPRLEAERDRLDSLLAGKPGDDLIASLRQEAETGDDDFDDAHRFFHHLLVAGQFRGEMAARVAIKTALAVLYPEGLRVVNQSWRTASIAAGVFEKRLERPDVQPGLDAASEYVKGGARAAAKRCIAAAHHLDEVLGRLDEAEARANAKPRERELFDARREASVAWSQFVSTVEFVLAGDDPDKAIPRERLLHRWRIYTSPGKTPQPAATEAPSTEPEPA